MVDSGSAQAVEQCEAIGEEAAGDLGVGDKAPAEVVAFQNLVPQRTPKGIGVERMDRDVFVHCLQVRLLRYLSQ